MSLTTTARRLRSGQFAAALESLVKQTACQPPVRPRRPPLPGSRPWVAFLTGSAPPTPPPHPQGGCACQWWVWVPSEDRSAALAEGARIARSGALPHSALPRVLMRFIPEGADPGPASKFVFTAAELEELARRPEVGERRRQRAPGSNVALSQLLGNGAAGALVGEPGAAPATLDAGAAAAGDPLVLVVDDDMDYHRGLAAALAAGLARVAGAGREGARVPAAVVRQPPVPAPRHAPCCALGRRRSPPHSCLSHPGRAREAGGCAATASGACLRGSGTATSSRGGRWRSLTRRATGPARRTPRAPVRPPAANPGGAAVSSGHADSEELFSMWCVDASVIHSRPPPLATPAPGGRADGHGRIPPAGVRPRRGGEPVRLCPRGPGGRGRGAAGRRRVDEREARAPRRRCPNPQLAPPPSRRSRCVLCLLLAPGWPPPACPASWSRCLAPRSMPLSPPTRASPPWRPCSGRAASGAGRRTTRRGRLALCSCSARLRGRPGASPFLFPGSRSSAASAPRSPGRRYRSSSPVRWTGPARGLGR